MKIQFPAWLRLFVAGITLGALAGCASAPSAEETGPTSTQAHAGTGAKGLAADLRTGMTPEQVRQALGNPAEIRPVKVPEGTSEQWIYRRRVNRVVDQRPTGTQDVPYVDPYTGQMRMIPEPVYSQVTTTVTEEAHLFWFNGELVRWDTLFRGDRSYDK